MAAQKTCSICGKRILKERIKALPETTTCTKCSKAKPISATEIEVDGSELGEMIKTVQGPRDR